MGILPVVFQPWFYFCLDETAATLLEIGGRLRLVVVLLS